MVFSGSDSVIFTQNVRIRETLFAKDVRGFYNTTLRIGNEDLNSVTLDSSKNVVIINYNTGRYSSTQA